MLANLISANLVFASLILLFGLSWQLFIFCSASHLPYNRNGLKFFTNAGGLGKADIKDILERAAIIYDNFSNDALKESELAASAAVRKADYMNIYTANLVEAVRRAAGNIGNIPHI